MNTVRVRVLVAVDRNGEWTASGTSCGNPKEWIYVEELERGEVYHWIEADVPLPAEAGPAIEATVTC